MDLLDVALLITDPAAADPLTGGRVTLQGPPDEVPDAEYAAALERFRGVHPSLGTATGERLYRVEVHSVYYAQGDGELRFVDPADYRRAVPDPLYPHARRILEHMNADHADAMVLYCRAFGERPDATTARMVAVDRYGFTMRAADTPGGDEVAVRIGFGERVDTLGAARAAMVALVQKARGGRA